MDAWRNPGRRWLWITGLVVMVTLVTVDTILHLKTTYYVTTQHISTPPEPDESSPTGYALGQRDLILPYVGMDGYHWVMQTQQMFADGDLRVRSVDYDNYDNGPKGREMHWSSSFRWWVAALAWLEHVYGAVPLPDAVEDVIPFANTLLILLLVIGVTPSIARRLGAGPATLVSFGMLAVSPLYESFSEGKSDHHGLAALSGLLTLLFLLAGGAGWVRSENSGDETTPANSSVWLPDSMRTRYWLIGLAIVGGIGLWFFTAAEGRILVAVYLGALLVISLLGHHAQMDDTAKLRAWLPDRAMARRWFIASAVTGGIGLWVSTASEAPVLAEVGLGALLATGLLGRNGQSGDIAKPDPTLWRVWGIAGAVTSVFFYLLEYFPSHFGMRLEINHPLYALAWAGGGELLCRLSRWWSGEKLASTAMDWLALAASALAVAIVPLLIYFYASQVFWVADRFLFIFHEDYIAEFKSLGAFVAGMYTGASRAYLPTVVNPLFLLAVPLVAWCWRDLRQLILILACAWVIGSPLYACWSWHASGVMPFTDQFWWIEIGAMAIAAVLALRWPPWFLLALGLPIYAAYLSEQTMSQLDDYFWPAVSIPIIVILALMALWKPWEEFSRPAKALLLLGLPPGLATLALSAREMRWMEIGYALWLAALAGTIMALALSPGYRWTWPRRIAAGIFLAAVMIPGPGLMVYGWFHYGWKAPMSDVEVMESVTRDVSQRLRARLGSDPGVVVSGPTTTTWMIYWGGFKGLGTLYWENLEGLKNTMDIYAAPSADRALSLIQARGVTHIALYSWDPFYEQYARLAHGWHKPTTEAEAEAEKPKLRDAFLYSVVDGRQVPQWLRPVYYPMPTDKILRGQWVMIFEVAPQQSKEESYVRLAQWQLAAGSAQNAFASVRNALQIHPNYLPALICGARIDQALNRQDEFAILIQDIHQQLQQAGSLELEERIDLAVLLISAKDDPSGASQIEACLHQADARSLRRTGTEELLRFLMLARQMNLTEARPGLLPFAFNLLPESTRMQYLQASAEYEASHQHWDVSLALLRRAIARDSDDIYTLNALAKFLATVPNAAFRNGREAVNLALHARELDKNQHPEIADTLACAYAEAGQFDLAVAVEQQALASAEAAKEDTMATQCDLHLGLFRNKLPYHE